MRPTIPAHKVIGDEGKPAQIVNPINHDMMDDMGKYAEQAKHAPVSPAPSKTHKPAHGGYPGEVTA